LKDGRIAPNSAQFEAVSDVRYHKAFETANPETGYQAEDLGILQSMAERSVAIVTAEHFTTWLEDFKIAALYV